MSDTVALDPALVESFRKRGFVVVPRLLEPAEIEHFGREVDRAVSIRTADDTRQLLEKSRYEQSFQQCLNLWEDFEAVRPLTFHPRIGAVAAALLGVPALRLWHDQALYKEPGGQSTPAHHDHAYWPMEETDAVTAWVPFQDVTRENGCMGYVPGSHGFGVRSFANIFTGEGFDLDHGPEARGVPAEFVDVPAGSVAFHHGLTLHTALPNRSSAPRRVHTMIYFADGTHRSASKLLHPCVERAGLAPGDRIASIFTPIAWPRPAGDLPSTPPRPDPPRRGWPGGPHVHPRSA